MAIGVWEPGGGKEAPPREVELDELRRFVQLARDGGLEDLPRALTSDELSKGAGLMKLEQEAWQVAEELPDDEIELLVRFFTRAEMELPGWEGGRRSPVVWLVKILRARDAFTPELRRWIKENSDNRFLPYGSVL